MKVCIIGNGLTSLSLAKTLTNQGLKVDLISNNLTNFYDKSQTLGISKNNIDFFNANIINIDRLLWNINKIEIYSENFNNEKILNFENEKKKLFSIIKNRELFDYLLSDLKKTKFFKFKRNLNENKFYSNYDLVINSDSKHKITKKFFFNKLNKNYNSYGHITIIKHNKLISNDTAVQIFTKNGPIAFLPISQTETSIVYSVRKKKNIDKNDLINFTKNNLKKYKIKKIENLKTFELKSNDLRIYHYKNMLAFGDLLHRIHPLAGQGFNMTIRDIKVLVELIDARINLGIQLDSSICSNFEKKTKSSNYLFSKSIDFIYEFFNFESKTNTALMSKSVQLLGKNKSINRFLTKMADTGFVI